MMLVILAMETISVTLPFHPLLTIAFGFLAYFVVVRIILEIWSKVIP